MSPREIAEAVNTLESCHHTRSLGVRGVEWCLKCGAVRLPKQRAWSRPHWGQVFVDQFVEVNRARDNS